MVRDEDVCSLVRVGDVLFQISLNRDLLIVVVLQLNYGSAETCGFISFIWTPNDEKTMKKTCSEYIGEGREKRRERVRERERDREWILPF